MRAPSALSALRHIGAWFRTCVGAFQFLSADVSKPHPQPFSLHIAAARTGENCGNVAGGSKN
jgi:hypothetical protein